MADSIMQLEFKTHELFIFHLMVFGLIMDETTERKNKDCSWWLGRQGLSYRITQKKDHKPHICSHLLWKFADGELLHPGKLGRENPVSGR